MICMKRYLPTWMIWLGILDMYRKNKFPAILFFDDTCQAEGYISSCTQAAEVKANDIANFNVKSCKDKCSNVSKCVQKTRPTDQVV